MAWLFLISNPIKNETPTLGVEISLRAIVGEPTVSYYP